MNIIDLLIILIILISIVIGWSKGFLRGVLDLVALIVSVMGAFFFYPYLAGFLAKYFDLDVWLMPVSFLATFLLIRALVGFAVYAIWRRMPEQANYSGFNRFLGIIPGFVNGLIHASIITALILAMPGSLSSKTKDSRLAGHFIQPAEWIENKLSPVFDEAIKKTLNKLTVEPGSKESVSLGYTVKGARPRPDLEKQMLDLVNNERAERGLPALTVDPALAEVARSHSKDMLERGYFSHINPEGMEVGRRVLAARLKYSFVGENIALTPTLEIAHQGLMDSPGHRANILHKGYSKIGIGILDAGEHGLMTTQNFGN